MGYTNKETTTLSSIKNRAERGKIDVIKLSFYSTDLDGKNDPSLFVDVDPSDIPDIPHTVVANVEYHKHVNYCHIKARSIFGLDFLDVIRE